MEPETLKSLMRAAAEQVIASAPELTALDQAIDDGDHGANMKRGFEAVLGKLDSITTQPLDEAFKTIGKTLVMTVGGASGPLYGSFFLAVGDALRGKRLPDDLADIFGSGVGAVSARGRSQAGEKTMLDVLFPVLETLKAEASHLDLIKRVSATASEAVARSSMRHKGPGLVSRCAQCRAYRSRRAIKLRLAACHLRHLAGAAMNDMVGIVIVSHSKDIARGTADMVRQMVGCEIKVAFCGGNQDGGLGTNVSLIIDAINNAWSPKGVAVLVDLGGAETNSEMAVEMLQPERRNLVVVCNAPIVEGAVMAAAEAAGGSSLDQVRAVAEELSAS